MGNLPFFLVLIAAALIQVALLTLFVLFLYRILISKQITGRQAASVAFTLALLNSSIGIIGYLSNDSPLTIQFFICYCFAVIGLGTLSAYIMRSPVSKIKRRHVFSQRRVLIYIVILLGLVGFYFHIHKPSSAEFLELQKQEQALHLPTGRRDVSDFGCQWVSMEDETQCMRDITRVYENTSLKQQITQSLLKNGWSSHTDATTKSDTVNFDKKSPVHFDSWDLYIKPSPQGELCAVVKLEYNSNYKKSGPWAVTLDLFGKTEDCQSHIS